MFYIEGLKNDEIRLEKGEYFEYELKIVSKKDNGRPSPFSLRMVSSEDVNVKITNGDTIKIQVQPHRILAEECIVLVNSVDEVIKLMIIPNEYYLMDKTYAFKITSKKLLDDGSLKLKIFSKVNDMDIGWKCTYDGKPLSYSITPFESEIGEHVVIVPQSKPLFEIDTLIEFTQDESKEKITMILKNTPNMGITSAEKKVD